jgi:hypothetical protein
MPRIWYPGARIPRQINHGGFLPRHQSLRSAFAMTFLKEVARIFFVIIADGLLMSAIVKIVMK